MHLLAAQSYCADCLARPWQALRWQLTEPGCIAAQGVAIACRWVAGQRDRLASNAHLFVAVNLFALPIRLSST
jgi:hypothetical protein